MAIVVSIAHVAALAEFFQLMAALFGLTAVLAMTVNRFFEVLFCFMNAVLTALVVAVAMVVTVGAGRHCRYAQECHA